MCITRRNVGEGGFPEGNIPDSGKIMILVELLRMLTCIDSYYWRLLRIRKWISVLHRRHNYCLTRLLLCLRNRTFQDDNMTSPCCLGSSDPLDFYFHSRVTVIIPVPVPFQSNSSFHSQRYSFHSRFHPVFESNSRSSYENSRHSWFAIQTAAVIIRDIH